MIFDTHMAKTPYGTEINNIVIDIAFFATSNLKNKSLLPITCNRLRFNLDIWSNIDPKQNNCKNMTQLAHFSVNIILTKGLAIAHKSTQPKKITIDVIHIYFLYTCTNLSSSFCSFAKIGNVTFPKIPVVISAG